MSEEKKLEKNSVNLLVVKWACTIVIPLLLLLIPTSETFSPQLRIFLITTIMAMLILCLELMDSFWVAIALPISWILFGVCGTEAAFKPWTSTQVWMVIGGYLLANVLDQCGILNRFAFWCLKKCKGKFNRILYATFLAGVVISFLTFANAFMITFLLCYTICKVFKQHLTKGAAVVMMVAQLAGVNAGIYVCNPMHFAFFRGGIQGVLPDYPIQWYHQIVYSIPLFFIALIVIFVLTKIYHTKDISSGDALTYFEEEYNKLGSLSIKEKKAAVVTLILLVYLFTAPYVGLDSNLGLIIFPLIYFLPGIRVADKTALQKVNFGMVVFVASCMAIGQVGSSLGIGAIVSQTVFPIVSKVPTIFAPLMVLILGIISNIIMTPAAMFSLFPAPLTQLAMDLKMSSPWPMNLPLLYSLDLIFFPYEQALCLIFFGFGAVKMKDFITVNVIKMAIFIVCFMLLVIPWWYLLGLF